MTRAEIRRKAREQGYVLSLGRLELCWWGRRDGGLCWPCFFDGYGEKRFGKYRGLYFGCLEVRWWE